MGEQIQNSLNNNVNTDPIEQSQLQNSVEDKVGGIDNPLLQDNNINFINSIEQKPAINQFGLPVDRDAENIEDIRTDNLNEQDPIDPANRDNPLLNDILNALDKQDGIDEMLEGLGIEGTKFGGVDLVEFQDLLDFETPESREEILNEVKRLKNYGYSDEQIKEYTVNSLEQYNEGYKDAIAEMQQQGNYSDEAMTPAEIKANLEANLSRIEIMNIPTLLNWVKANINSEILTNDLLNGMFTDPTSIKVLNALYNGSMKNNGVKTQEPRMINNIQNKMQIQPLQAMQFYKDWLGKQSRVSKEQTLEQINKLRGMIGDNSLGEFDELFNVLK